MEAADIIKLLDERIDHLRRFRDISASEWEVSEDPLDETYGVEYADTYNCGWVEGAAKELSDLRKKILGEDA